MFSEMFKKNGKSYLLVFGLVSSLFFLWALCNGMIDVMDKHFQDYLHLSKSESAWVQFAHYVGYFLMAMPAGWLAKKLGYKGGILAGLALVAFGCLWFVPATQVPALSHFWAFLVGVCMIAMGLTFLETIANPYTTVLGPDKFAAARINLAQSCNGVGWILGPIVGGLFFYSEQGTAASHKTLWIPYACIAAGVGVLMVAFALTKLPDLVGTDACHVDEDTAQPAGAARHDREVNRGLSYLLSLLNASVLAGTIGAIIAVVFSIIGAGEKAADGSATANVFGQKLIDIASKLPSFGATVNIESAPWLLAALVTLAAVAIAAVVLLPVVRKLHNQNIWTHPHFSSATLAQFFYVAAQAGIFSFFINYTAMESKEVAPASDVRYLQIEGHDAGPAKIEVAQEVPAAQASADPAAGPTDPKKKALQNPRNILFKKAETPVISSGLAKTWPVSLLVTPVDPKTNLVLKENEDTPETLWYLSEKGATRILALGGFVLFLLGRIVGSFLLRKASAHKMLGLYAVVNALLMIVIVSKMGWLSMGAVLLSFFFMSIMFPTIFALGIFGLGSKTKIASSFIVMGITGGALMPKVMGLVGDHYDMSVAFLVPLVCFLPIAAFGFFWPKLSGAKELSGVKTGGGH